MYGLTASDWQQVLQLAVEPLRTRGAKVYVFGSRARDSYQRFSDLDLLFECPTEIPLLLLGQIRSDLEESNLPIKVDLVSVDELPEAFCMQVIVDRKGI